MNIVKWLREKKDAMVGGIRRRIDDGKAAVKCATGRWYHRHALAIWLSLIVFVIVIVIGLWSGAFYCYLTKDSKTVTIVEVQSKRIGSKAIDTYLVYTDGGVFENTDCGWYLKWDSSDVQGKLMAMRGKKARIHYYGWRWPMRSWQPNILSVEPAS